MVCLWLVQWCTNGLHGSAWCASFSKLTSLFCDAFSLCFLSAFHGGNLRICFHLTVTNFSYHQSVQSVTVNSVLQRMCSVFTLSSLLKAQTKHGLYLKDSYLAVVRRSQALCYTCVIKQATVLVSQPIRPGSLLPVQDSKGKCCFTLIRNSSMCSHGLLLPPTCRSQAARDCFQGWEWVKVFDVQLEP